MKSKWTTTESAAKNNEKMKKSQILSHNIKNTFSAELFAFQN